MAEVYGKLLRFTSEERDELMGAWGKFCPAEVARSFFTAVHSGCLLLQDHVEDDCHPRSERCKSM